MTAIAKTFHNFEDNFDRRAEYFAFHHPCLAFLAMFIGMPVFILITVSVFTALIVLPLSLTFGWI